MAGVRLFVHRRICRRRRRKRKGLVDQRGRRKVRERKVLWRKVKRSKVLWRKEQGPRPEGRLQGQRKEPRPRPEARLQQERVMRPGQRKGLDHRDQQQGVRD